MIVLTELKGIFFFRRLHGKRLRDLKDLDGVPGERKGY